MKVSWDDDIPKMEKIQMFQTTNQYKLTYKPR